MTLLTINQPTTTFMKEQFVSAAIAQQLKEKGFTDECMANYEISLTAQENEEDGFSGPFGWEKGEVIFNKGHFVNGLPYCDFSSKKWLMCAAPLWQQVIDWLSNVHNIHIGICHQSNGMFDIWKNNGKLLLSGAEYKEFKTYSEARQTAIEHALTLI